MNILKHVVTILALAALLAMPACSKSGDGPSKKQDIPGACECALDCANTITVDDTASLVQCKTKCQKKFGAKAMIEGVKRSMEVLTQARESCSD